MASYRETIKEHFENIPAWKKILDVDFLFWGIGLATYLAFVIERGIQTGYGSTFSAITLFGYWCWIFGIAAAFIKRNERGLLIAIGGYALLEIIMDIIQTVDFGFSIHFIFDIVAYTLLFILALRSSDIHENMMARRVQQAAMFMGRPQPVAGATCASCGAPMSPDSVFCNACGGKRPERKKCAACGIELTDTAMFCDKCGAPVGEVPSGAQNRCATCGQAVSADDVFCPNCGAKTAAAGPLSPLDHNREDK